MYRFQIRIKTGKKYIIYCACSKIFYAIQILQLIINDIKNRKLIANEVYIYDNKLKKEI